MNTDLEKVHLRKSMRDLLENQSDSDRLNKSRLIMNKIRKNVSFKNANTIMFYYATDEEVATLELLEESWQAGKQVALPYIDEEKEIKPSVLKNLNDLVPGSYGIMQPRPQNRKILDVNEIDLILVPGLAFDKKGSRLGRGKGYYDRFLNLLPKKMKKIGLAFDFQMVEHVPANALDQKVDLVITNE